MQDAIHFRLIRREPSAGGVGGRKVECGPPPRGECVGVGPSHLVLIIVLVWTETGEQKG